MLLLIDNFDSFTYNIVHAFQKLGQSVRVVRNNERSLQECLRLNPDYIVIGPGPGNPSGAGISKECIAQNKDRCPLLGICLGHQAFGEVFGGKVCRAKYPLHGKQSRITHNNTGLFKQLPQGFLATRYNSLIVKKETLPDSLIATAVSEDGEIMGLQHAHYPLHGVQFHPESIATEWGMELLSNFLREISNTVTTPCRSI